MSSSELRELYQEVILDHSKHPRNYRFPEGATCSAEGYNPLCGDQLTIHCIVRDERIVDVGFQGSGCAISKAAASTMTEAVKGMEVAAARDLFESYHAVVTGEGEADEDVLGKLIVFAGVAEFPMRVKCATLAWHTLQSALSGDNELVTTE